jgi:hypothetical protein
MTVSAVPFEQTSSWPPGARFSRANAFRVLSVPADAELKQIYRQQQRLLVALEIGGLDGTGKGGSLTAKRCFQRRDSGGSTSAGTARRPFHRGAVLGSRNGCSGDPSMGNWTMWSAPYVEVQQAIRPGAQWPDTTWLCC